MAAKDAAAIPLPSDETTPPVTKIYLVVMLSLRKTSENSALEKSARTGRQYNKAYAIYQTANYIKYERSEEYGVIT
ncbi:hypothetical protein L9G15_02870 [Shewanella sp. A3A]|nr:hypothetical protein [Shewanella ferrihydritica]